MIRINQIKLPVNHNEAALEQKIRKLLKLHNNENITWKIFKKSVDARKKEEISYVYAVNVHVTNANEEKLVKKINNKNIILTNDGVYAAPSPVLNRQTKIIIAGSGPAGLFCGLFLARAGYKPVILERGSSVDERSREVEKFWETGILNVNTNVQFGEGGAGTFSDGKLNTAVKEKSGRIRKVLETFVEFGAPEHILYMNKPHIGTDILKTVVKNIRLEIEKYGGKVLFNSQVTDFDTTAGRICSVTVNNADIYECNKLVMAIGHSARDTFTMLRDKDVLMEQKPFAMGFRIEHPQTFINAYAYGREDIPNLPTADYKVTARAENGRGVYSFCMCPGGYVVNASSEEGMLCVNGMSYSSRAGVNANSAIIVTVNTNDFKSNDVLAGMYLQREAESAVYRQKNGAVIYQLNEDFVVKRPSSGPGSVIPRIKGKHMPGDLNEVLPEYLCESIVDGMKTFDKIIEGFNMPQAVFSGVESRTSSPVRILRNDSMESISIRGLYPCGEGAGYAGGITSAAVDGIKVYEAIVTMEA